jgi:hypothetical protein
MLRASLTTRLLILTLVLLGIAGQPLVVTGQGNVSESGKAAPQPSTPSAQEATGSQQSSNEPAKATLYSSVAVGLVLAIIMLMALLFYFLFAWSNRVERSGFFAVLHRETIENIEYARLAAPIEEQWMRGDYQRELIEAHSNRAQAWAKEGDENRKPDPGNRLRSLARQVGRPWELDDAESQVLREFRVMEDPWAAPTRPPGLSARRGHGGLGGVPGGGGGAPGRAVERTPEEHQLETEFDTMLDDYGGRLKAWVDRARTRVAQCREQDLAEIRARAKAQADRALDVDFSALRGRGSEFVLEFTTVVVIIFAAVILGVLRVLDTQQIGTLLAAIAGYVLGRASRGRSAQAEATSSGAQAPAVSTARSNAAGKQNQP